MVSVVIEGAHAYLTLFVAQVLWFCRLIGMRRSLADADKTFVLYSPAGFGHTITGPDLARRLYPDARIVFIIFFLKGDFRNPVFADVWPDVDVRYLPRVPFVSGGHTRELLRRFDGISSRLVSSIWRLFSKSGASMETVEEFYGRIGEAIELSAVERSDLTSVSRFLPAMARYVQVVQERPAKKLRLPDTTRKAIVERLTLVAGPDAKFCGLYLRLKGRDDGRPTTENVRNGSDLDAYGPAMEDLVAAGYRVLLIGDRPLDEQDRNRYAGAVLDADSIGVEPLTFSAFVSTESTIFIGEAGGGVWPACANAIPMLITNMFPTFQGLPNATMLYKTVRDRDGNQVPLQDLIVNYPFQYIVDGFDVLSNDAETLRRAVAYFIGVRQPSPAIMRRCQTLESHFMRHTIFKIGGCRMSPACIESEI